MRKILFLDRDGVLLEEPKIDFQIDSLDKFKLVPGVVYALARIVREMDYLLVMVTNQDGLGTPSFPEETFWPAHQLLLDTLAGEGVHFHAVHVDRSFEHEGKDTRKPGIGMLRAYLDGTYDLANSVVVGDRITDMKLAQNLGAKGVFIQNNHAPTGFDGPIDLITDNWERIYQYLKLPPRRVTHQRTTKETDIFIELNLDGTGQSDIHTGLGFFDHMLEQLARHGQVDLTIKVKGDLHIDEHHTIEDTALALGTAFKEALGNKIGLQRYGFCLPMDDVLAQVALDFGGRPWLVWEADFHREKVGDMPTEMFMHFFKSFSDNALCNLSISAQGTNEHHKIEAIFKAFAKSIRMAVQRDPNNNQLPSTKGVL